MKKTINLLGAVLVLSLLLGGCGETRRKPKLYVSVPQELFVAAEGETECEGYAGSCETRAKVSNAGTGTLTWKVTTDQVVSAADIAYVVVDGVVSDP